MDLYRIKKYCLNPSSIINACDLEILNTSEEFIHCIFDLIKKARKSILIEFYEIADDKLGIEIKNLLIKKVSEGVEVRIIYDSIGSMLTSKEYFKELKKNGIKVIEYNPIKIFSSIRKWFRRDHRKIIISDFSQAIVGGFNLSLDYAPYSFSGKNWKDLGVKFGGQAVLSVSNIFRSNWVYCGGDFFEIMPDDYVEGNIPVSLAWEFGMRNIHSVRRSYKYAMDNAKDYIYITNAYFLPDGLIYRCLTRAVIRGVDVKIILPSKTDHPYVRIASMAIIKHLIRHGVKVYEWQKEVLHAKTAVIDGLWVSIGSHNLDRISLHYNLELNINIFDEKIGQKMKGNFEEDLKNSKELTLDYIKRMPLSTKMMSQFMYIFRNLL
ncbi:MAG: phosphatidylserine/phosphatidylglycerophosphate/cardiolipin synthase family protein [Elusimicrobiota bacterium]